MKKLLLGLLSLLFIISLSACNDTKSEDDGGDINYNTPVMEEGSQDYIVSISLNLDNAKLEYYLSEQIDTSGVKVIATYNNNETPDLAGSTKDITNLVTFDTSEYNPNKEGTYNIHVLYDDQKQQLYASYEVVVNNMIDYITDRYYAVGLEVDLNNVKLEYNWNEEKPTFNDLKIKVYMKDTTNLDAEPKYSSINSNSKEVNVDTSMIDMNRDGYYFVIVSYTDEYETSLGINQKITVSNSFTIKINNPLKSIEFLSGNVTVDQYAKLEYSDWQVEATYESGLKEVVDYNLLKIEYDINTAGEQDAVVSYEENNIVVTTKVKINVKEAELSFNSLFFTADSLALSDNITTTTSWYDEDGYAPNMITFTSGAKVTSNSKEADGYSFKNRLQLQKKSNIILDLAMFNGKNITIKLYAMSGNSNEIRSIELYKNEIIEQTALTSMSFDGKNLTSQEYTFNCDGSTYLIKDVDGVNVYGILITIN